MKVMLRTFFILFLNALALPVVQANWIFIANKNVRSQNVNLQQLQKLYSGKSNTINGQTVKAINQPNQTDVFSHFYHDVFGWSKEQADNYWARMVLSGKALQPVTLVSNDFVNLVALTPTAVAYVDIKAYRRSPNRSKVNVIFRGPKEKVNSGGIDLSGGHHQLSLPIPKGSTHGAIDLSSSNSVNWGSFDRLSVKTLDRQPHSILAHSHQFELPIIEPHNSLWLNLTRNFSLNINSNNVRVNTQVQWYLHHKHALAVVLNNAIPYLAYVYQQVKKDKIPAEFALLPMLESGYNPFAYSKVGAAGIWQMMPQTATLNGLNISWWYDSRRDILMSTRAALRYLNDLHKQFHHWALAAAAYNAGSGAVEKAIKNNLRQAKPTDYFNLNLPKETQEYVPKFFALVEIVKHAKRYHVTLPPLTRTPFFTTLTLKTQMNLDTLSHLSGVSVNLLHYLNPGMRRFATSPDGLYTLLLPSISVPRFTHRLSQLSGKQYESLLYHEVYSGETLSKIAKNYKTSVQYLAAINHLDSSEVITGEGMLVPVKLGKTYKPVKKIGGTAQLATMQYTRRHPSFHMKREDAGSSVLNGSKRHHGRHKRFHQHVSITHKRNIEEDQVLANPVQRLVTWVFYNINLLH